MRRQRSSNGNRPFAGLAGRLAEEKIRLPQTTLPEPPKMPMSAAAERRLFRAAMAGVTPMDRANTTGRGPAPKTEGQRHPDDPDAETIARLRRLVERGEGFDIASTAEYVEGSSCPMPAELFRRLHGGHYAIQDHVDLHGLNRPAARACFDDFMRRAIAAGRHSILVVHGRGRCSPGPPVLKREVIAWLTRGVWKRWVIAFASARACDGGSGATVVLLRRTPRRGK